MEEKCVQATRLSLSSELTFNKESFKVDGADGSEMNAKQNRFSMKFRV